MADQVLKLYKNVYITEDIIHNRAFMADMIAKGAIKVSFVEEIPDGNVVMFSAHGVSPEIVKICEKKGLTIVDATCPTVTTIQESIIKDSKEGKTIIIIGNKSHPEVIGLAGCISNQNPFVVSNEDEIDLLPDMQNSEVVYYTQTTLERFVVDGIIEALKRKIPHIKSVKNDYICNATLERQEVIKKIASQIDLFIVVGSKHSSNTMRLTEVATRFGAKNVIRIDTKDEINEELLQNVETIAITAGTSAPEYLVQDVLNFLHEKIKDIEIRNFQ
jgi:4-hydroxy-3-methylbut-2-enyl diphosphate reductase